LVPSHVTRPCGAAAPRVPSLRATASIFLSPSRAPALCICSPDAFLNPLGHAVLQRDAGGGASAVALSPILASSMGLNRPAQGRRVPGLPTGVVRVRRSGINVPMYLLKSAYYSIVRCKRWYKITVHEILNMVLGTKIDKTRCIVTI
jgi:hypothetical protein